MSKKKSSTKKTSTKKTGKKAASTERLRKDAIASIEQNIARVDGEPRPHPGGEMASTSIRF